LPSARHCHSERSYFAGRHSANHALPSVYSGHSAKYIFLFFLFPTFGLYWTLGKPGFAEGPTASFFAECKYSGHSAKSESLLSVTLWALGTGSAPSLLPGAVTVTFLYQVPGDTRQVFAECPTKSTRQISRCRCTVRRAFFAERHTR
jgi:hypothetical protein